MRHAHPAPADFTATHHRWSELTPDLLEGWRTLLDRSGTNVTLGPDWVSIAAEAFGEINQLQVYLEHQAETVVTAIPYLKTTRRIAGFPLRTLLLGSNRVSYHPELLTELDVGQTLARFLAGTTPWEVFSAANIVAGTSTATAIERWCQQHRGVLLTYEGEVSPYVPIATDWASFMSGKPKKFRYKQRKAAELCSQGDRFTLRWFESVDEIADLFNALVAIEKRSWKARIGVDIPSHPLELGYYQKLLPHLARTDKLLCNVLYADGQPIAYSLCARHGAWIGQLKTGFDERFEDVSPGAAVIQACLQRAFELGAQEFDFLGHTDKHKRAWSTVTRPHVHHFAYANGTIARGVGVVKRLKRRLVADTPELPLRPDDA